MRGNAYNSKDYQELVSLGIMRPGEKPGFSVEHGDEYFARCYYEDQREQGFEVPEDRQPQIAPRKEREIKYQSKMMHDIEGERVDRVPEGFPDPNMWYDDDEIVYDRASQEWIPEWKFIKREKERLLDSLNRQRMERCYPHIKAKYERKVRNALLREAWLKKKHERELQSA